MDPSKPGKGILASLEHKTAEPRRSSTFAPAAPSAARGAALIAGSGVLVAAVLAWWLYSGPSPVIVHEALPPPLSHVTHAMPAQPEPDGVDDGQAAAIIDEAPPPLAKSSPALAAVLAPAPIATVVMRRERAAPPRPHLKQKPGPRTVAVAREHVRKAAPAAPDTDVALLSALVAHASIRDVVEARTGDSTETLLERCRRVGGEEGRLCRVRICTSRAGEAGCHGD